MALLFDVVSLRNPSVDAGEHLADAAVLAAPLGYHVGMTEMARTPRLKAIMSNTTGVAHIDVDEANRRGIKICALHDEQAFLDSITPTAEHAIGLMLAASRRLPAVHASAVSGQWNRRNWGAPAMMSRLRLGLVGYGRLGRKVGAIGQAMGMDVAFFDPAVAGSMPDLLGLARRSDVLSVHAVATQETKGIVSRAVLEALPAGAIVINTARGELLDLEALLDLLEAGHLYSAALDVIDGEYASDFEATFSGSRVRYHAKTHDNLILTPHIGGSTQDAWAETERFVIDKAARACGLVVT
jgi:D-3-phosphoglycerate dehydrogenase